MGINENCEQPKICAEIFKGIDEKFKVSNHRIDNLNEKTDHLGSIDAALVKLTLLSEQNVENNKNRDEILRIHGETLVQLTTALKHINEKFKETDGNIEEVRQNVETMDNNGSLKINEIFKYIFFLGIGSGATLLITKLFG